MPMMIGMVVMSVMMLATKTHSISLLQHRVYASPRADVKRRASFIVGAGELPTMSFTIPREQTVTVSPFIC